MNHPKAVTLAVITGAHGVMGEVRLKLFGSGKDGGLGSLKPHKSFNQGNLTLKSLRPNKGGAIARFDQITDRNAAEAARGTELTVPRDDLPALSDDEFYYTDLLGLPVHLADGKMVGTICAVENFGAGDVIEIEKTDGKKFMVPIGACNIDDCSVLLDAAFAE